MNRRVVAAGDRLYAALGLGEPVTAIDAATGKTLRVYEGPEFAEEIICAKGILYLIIGSSEVKQRDGTYKRGLYKRGEPEPTT